MTNYLVFKCLKIAGKHMFLSGKHTGCNCLISLEKAKSATVTRYDGICTMPAVYQTPAGLKGDPKYMYIKMS